ncbi:hypothetical protein LZG74_16255 [Dyadobacter sp. CY327]|uniref:hypothetical protein n=1 Tax=Dyadobacter sp. CY327 TaxID=2907301 RepID=UPI001F1C2885|nr:hypothetical protein [Dyadobacter sp. CY327]MCE7071873.1 hypothetical protein [Dyadobacter sp. CY327]
MKNQDVSHRVSPTTKGITISAQTSVELTSASESRRLFELAKGRLFDVSSWQSMTGTFYANFELTNAFGHPITGDASENNLFRIDIPGPGSVEGRGHDWVLIEKITHQAQGEYESISITVRPCPNPMSQDETTAHFYHQLASSTFSIAIQDLKVTASVVDQQVRPNMEPKPILAKLRNALVGLGGMILFSKMQWKSLTKGLLGQP